MTEISRPVLKHLAATNFKNWDKVDEIIKRARERKAVTSSDELYIVLSDLVWRLKEIRDNIKFIDETFRDYLEEE